MTDLLHELAAGSSPESTAMISGKSQLSYDGFCSAMSTFAGALVYTGLIKQDRIAVYLPKTLQTVITIFGSTMAGGIFVPINPVLKSNQVAHILRDSGSSVLVTSSDRYSTLGDVIGSCPDLKHVILIDDKPALPVSASPAVHTWQEFMESESGQPERVIDADIAGILYTSGSTGAPKGVVLSHRNFVVGAKSVSSYLEMKNSDRILAVLPLSFDAGFSQLTTSFFVGATVVLHDFFLPRDVVRIAEKERVTGITAVPPLWVQIADQEWRAEASNHVRLIANTGGKMPRKLLQKLRQIFPYARPFLMYGLTEAFRSTYLPPAEVDRIPHSIGKAIPNAEILVVRDDGTECGAGEPGELLHRGALVAQGYWNDPEKTSVRFRPHPLQDKRICRQETVVYSGDTVKKDDEGFLYFVGRKDDMIKTSGYRVSPTEIEEAGFESGVVKEIAALGTSDDRLGQKIVVFAAPLAENQAPTEALLAHFGSSLPNYMVPDEIIWRASLPRGANGKIDRQKLAGELNSANQEQ